MSRRTDLGLILRSVLGSQNVYFQPPKKQQIAYPCIIYALDDIHMKSADDMTYFHKKMYSVTLVDKNPDSEFVDKIIELPLCRFSRFYTVDNLNHWVFEIFY